MYVYVLFASSMSLTYIALQPLGVFNLSSTKIALHSEKMRMTSLTPSTCHISCTKMCVYVLFPSLTSSTSSTYIALQPLDVFDLSLTSLTYIALHSKQMRMTSLTSLTCHIPCTLFEL